jgi:hypothetical protein
MNPAPSPRHPKPERKSKVGLLALAGTAAGGVGYLLHDVAHVLPPPWKDVAVGVGTAAVLFDLYQARLEIQRVLEKLTATREVATEVRVDTTLKIEAGLGSVVSEYANVANAPNASERQIKQDRLAEKSVQMLSDTEPKVRASLYLLSSDDGAKPNRILRLDRFAVGQGRPMEAPTSILREADKDRLGGANLFELIDEGGAILIKNINDVAYSRPGQHHDFQTIIAAPISMRKDCCYGVLVLDASPAGALSVLERSLVERVAILLASGYELVSRG